MIIVTIREKQEQWEQQYLCEYAAHSADTAGRQKEEPQCDIRTVYIVSLFVD